MKLALTQKTEGRRQFFRSNASIEKHDGNAATTAATDADEYDAPDGDVPEIP